MNYIFDLIVWYLSEGKRYISNEIKGYDELGVYFFIILRNEFGKNCIYNLELKMN